VWTLKNLAGKHKLIWALQNGLLVNPQLLVRRSLNTALQVDYPHANPALIVAFTPCRTDL
jgi:hypothetical protein